MAYLPPPPILLLLLLGLKSFFDTVLQKTLQKAQNGWNCKHFARPKNEHNSGHGAPNKK